MRQPIHWYWCTGQYWMHHSSIVCFLGKRLEVETWVISLGEPLEDNPYQKMQELVQQSGRAYRGGKRIL